MVHLGLPARFRIIGVHGYPAQSVLPSEILKRIKLDLDRIQRSLPPGCSAIIGGEKAKQVDSRGDTVGEYL
jgi:hypothetical protein